MNASVLILKLGRFFLWRPNTWIRSALQPIGLRINYSGGAEEGRRGELNRFSAVWRLPPPQHGDNPGSIPLAGD